MIRELSVLLNPRRAESHVTFNFLYDGLLIVP